MSMFFHRKNEIFEFLERKSPIVPTSQQNSLTRLSNKKSSQYIIKNKKIIIELNTKTKNKTKKPSGPIRVQNKELRLWP